MLIALAQCLSFFIAIAAGLTCVLAAILLLEVLASFLPARAYRRQAAKPVQTAILMPAHNEALGIGETLRRLKNELLPGDRFVVIADNCDDETARIAKAEGAEVVIRNDPVRRGKGFALEYGVRYLSEAPPDVVIILDADCYAETGALQQIGAQAFNTQRPVQARYDLDPPPGASSDYLTIASLAWTIKNYIRPLGLRKLGLPCQLMGTGMAFPWDILVKARLGTDNIVEDIALGLELAESGRAPLFLPAARVLSTFPESAEGQNTQRARWERGHLNIIARQVPSLLARAAANGNLNLFTLAADIAVPPLTFLLFAIAGTGFTALLTVIAGGWITPLVLSALAAIFLISAIVLSIWQIGQSNYYLMFFRRIPAYALSKLTVYAAALSGKPIGWIRSKRD
ncbi:MAG: glycosyltransferase family 2 protein [Hyphomicrobiales bacterium]|nr:glycosyltransferase family 2 protein [Hyphomicrobiales bacterium]